MADFEAEHRAKGASLQLTPPDQSRIAALLCRLSSHSWDVHPFKEGDESYDAVTCRVCRETRVVGWFETEGES